MLERRALLVQQFEELAKVIIEDIHDSVDATLFGAGECEATLAVYQNSAISLEDKILHVETRLKELHVSEDEKDNQPPDGLYIYYLKLRHFLRYQKNFFSPLPTSVELTLLDHYLESIDDAKEMLNYIPEQINFIKVYAKLVALSQRNAAMENLKQSIQDAVRLARNTRADFYVNTAPLETQSVAKLLHNLQNYYQQELMLIQQQLANNQHLGNEIKRIAAETQQILDELKECLTEKCAEFKYDDVKYDSWLLRYHLKETQATMKQFFNIFAATDSGQMKLLLTTSVPVLANLSKIMSNPESYEKVSVLIKQLNEEREDFFNDVVYSQRACVEETDDILESCKWYREILKAYPVISQADGFCISSTLSAVPVPDTILLQDCQDNLELKKQQLQVEEASLASIFSTIGGSERNEQVASSLKNNHALQCHLALAELVSKSIACLEEASTPNFLSALAETLLAEIKRDDATFQSLLVQVDQVLEDETMQALLFGSELYDAMERLRLTYNDWCSHIPEVIEVPVAVVQENKMASELPEEKEQPLTPAVSTPVSTTFGGYWFGFWPVVEPQTPPQLQNVIAHMPEAVRQKTLGN